MTIEHWLLLSALICATLAIVLRLWPRTVMIGPRRNPDRVSPTAFVDNVRLFRPRAIRILRAADARTFTLSFLTDAGSYCETILEDPRGPTSKTAPRRNEEIVIGWLNLVTERQWRMGTAMEIENPLGLEGYLGFARE